MTVTCFRHAQGEAKPGKCYRCKNTTCSSIRDVPWDNELSALREYEEKAKSGSSDRVNELAAAWRKAAGFEKATKRRESQPP